MSGVSVVIPTRIVRHRRHDAVACRQSEVDLEVIVVDDGSTDATPEVVAAAADSRVTLRAATSRMVLQRPAILEPGGRVASGSGSSTTTTCGVPTSSRASSPPRTRRTRWVYVGAVAVGERLEIVSGDPPPSPEAVMAVLPRSNPVPGGGSNVILRRDLFEGVGGFDERLAPCEDWELWARLTRHGPPAAGARTADGIPVARGHCVAGRGGDRRRGPGDRAAAPDLDRLGHGPPLVG